MRLVSLSPILLLGCTRTEEDRALLLGAGSFAESAAFAVGLALADGDDPATLTALSAPDKFDGSVPILVASLDRQVERCYDGTVGAWQVTVSLGQVLFHGAPNAGSLDEDFDCVGAGGVCDRDRGFSFDPLDLALTGTLVLELEAEFHDNDARSVRSSVSLPTTASLTGEAVWIERTAAVNLEATVDFDEFGVDVEVAGCVDGRRDHYDYYSVSGRDQQAPVSPRRLRVRARVRTAVRCRGEARPLRRLGGPPGGHGRASCGAGGRHHRALRGRLGDPGRSRPGGGELPDPPGRASAGGGHREPGPAGQLRQRSAGARDAACATSQHAGHEGGLAGRLQQLRRAQDPAPGRPAAAAGVGGPARAHPDDALARADRCPVATWRDHRSAAG